MSSEGSSDNLVVLFLLGWGILIVCAFVKAVYSCIRKLCYGDEGRRIIDGDDDSAERYRNMSPERQEEIDNLRKHALLRYLSRFTLVSADEIADILTTQLFRSWIVYVCIAHNSPFSQHPYTDTGRRRLALLRGVTD